MASKTQDRPDSVTTSVTRVAGARGGGSPVLWAFGLREIAQVTGLSVPRLAGMVASGALDPLNLLEISVLRRRRRRRPPLTPVQRRALIALRPDSVLDSCRVQMPAGGMLVGFSGLWAISYRDIARLGPEELTDDGDPTPQAMERVWRHGKVHPRNLDGRPRFTLGDLASVLDYVEAELDPALGSQLGLVDGAPAS